MSDKLILGISGSPRKGANTDFLLKTTLDEAALEEGIRTETIYLRDYDITPCNSCFACCNDIAEKKDRPCVSFSDGMDELYPKLLECDALVIGSPAFFGSMTAQTKAFMDRTEGLLRYGRSSYKNGLSNKIGAALTVGGNRNGGEEFTLQAIHYYYFIQNMIVVGTGPDPTPGCYLGASGTTWPNRGKVRNAVEEDELGIKSAKMLGRRVSSVLKMMK